MSKLTEITKSSLREKFEKYSSDNGAWPNTIIRSGDGYKMMQAQAAWVNWQACAEALLAKEEESAASAVPDDVMERINIWANAYPFEVFPEPDFEKAAKVLKENGMTLDSISAAAMRHVITKVRDMLAAPPTPPAKSEPEWIPVEQSLPELDQFVLVYEDDNDNPQDAFLGGLLGTFRQKVSPAQLQYIDREGYPVWCLCTLGGGPVGRYRNVTHWRPLPAAPTEAKSEPSK